MLILTHIYERSLKNAFNQVMSWDVWRHPKNYFNHINSTIEDLKKKNRV